MRTGFPALVTVTVLTAALIGCGDETRPARPPDLSPTPEPTAVPPTPVPTPSPTPPPIVWAAGCGPTTIDRQGDCPPGLLVRSDDGGRTWSQRRFEHDFRDLAFVDRRTGWAAAVGDVLETADGGGTWEGRRSRLSSSDGSCTRYFLGVAFLDADTGVVVGLASCGLAAGNSFALRTSDGGLTWDEVFTGLPRSWGGGGLTRVCFTGAGIGLASGGGITLVSPDRGETWTRVDALATGLPSGTSIACSGEQDLWLVNEVYPWVHHSPDGGVTWADLSQTLPPGPPGVLSTIGFLDAHLGWIAAGQDTLVLTRDGGASWEIKTLGRGPIPFESAAFLDETHGIAFSWSVVALTDDGGNSWSLVGVTPGELTRFLDVEIAR